MSNWYHSFSLPGTEPIVGVISEDQLRLRFEAYQVHDDLSGKRVLDVGAWDGWFSFEMERRGAEVVAIDNFRNRNFLKIHRLLASRVDYRVLDVHQLNPEALGYFDLVLCLGVLYHVKHPLLALQNVCSVTRDLAIVESYVTDNPDIDGLSPPLLAFHEGAELRGHLDNWFVPNSNCFSALCRTAGFVNVTEVDRRDNRVALHCHRQWGKDSESPLTLRPRPEMMGARHYRNGGVNVSTTHDDYLSVWARSPELDARASEARVTVGSLAAPLVWSHQWGEAWQLNVMIPPGLTQGWHDVRLSLTGCEVSDSCRIAVDLPLDIDELTLAEVCHSETWQPGCAKGDKGSYVCLFVAGLPDNADHSNVLAFWGEVEVDIQFVGPVRSDALRQVNGQLTDSLSEGPHPFVVCCGLERSGAKQVIALID